jgi:hypothetical protein
VLGIHLVPTACRLGYKAVTPCLLYLEEMSCPNICSLASLGLLFLECRITDLSYRTQKMDLIFENEFDVLSMRASMRVAIL